LATKKVVTEVVQAVFALPWLVARDEGLFEAEGLEVEFVGGVPRDPSLPPELDPTKVDPFWRHGIFEQQGAEFFNACHWGQIRRSDDSSVGGRIVSIRPAIATQAIVVRPDSEICTPEDLRGKTIGVNFHAGSHYLTLRMLEGFMPREEIKVAHMGEAKPRYLGMLDGRLDACALMEPWITIAEKAGCHNVIEGAYKGAEMAAPNIDEETHAAISRAITGAVRLINGDKRRYLRYFVKDVPPEFGPIEESDFRLSRLRYVEPRPYPLDEFERTRQWMISWNLLPADATYEDIIDSRVGVR
jgi:NitT/TauT family transport system substrate-binding protein